MIGSPEIAGGQDQNAFHYVAQLADVAGPRLDLQGGVSVVGQAPARQARGDAEAVQIIVDEVGDVLAPLAETRHAQGHDIEAMEQILAQAAGGDLLTQVAAGGGDDANVHLNVRVAADPAESLIDQNPQQPALGLPRHLGDLVDVERPAVGPLEYADLGAVGRSRLPLRKTRCRFCPGVMPAALMTTNSPLALGLAAWIRRAAVSLPAPGGPEISTRLLAGATLVII